MHRREEVNYQLVPGKSRRLFAVEGRSDWRVWGYIEKMAERYKLVPYWPDGMVEPTRAERLGVFLRAIYPLWKPIEKAALGDKAATDLTILHTQDLAIHDYANTEIKGEYPKPQRDLVLATPQDEKKEKGKQADQQHFKDVMED